MKKGNVCITVVSCVLFLFSVVSVSAEMRAGAVSLFPLVGGYVFEEDQDLDNSLTLGLGIGYNLDERWGIEGSLSGINTESDVTDEGVNAYLYRLEGLYHFNISDRFVPYLAAGVGGITISPDNGGTTNSPLLNYGAGVKYFLTDNLALRGDVRHVISFGSTRHNLLYTAGLTFFFGGEKEAVAAAAPPPALKPAPAPAPAPPPKLEPKPAPPPKPEPKDSDGDGVYDDADECPGTPARARVDKRGCWVLKGVLFDFDKSIIKQEGRPVLDEVVVVLNSNPSLRVDIQGHTDSTGTEEWNQGLSERRAKAVMDYLVTAGIDPKRLTTQGFGEGSPAVSNETREGRALNRRVELKPVQ